MATLRGQNPFLEALEAKKAFKRDTEMAETGFLHLSVDEALALERQYSLELAFGNKKFEEELETCPICFQLSLCLNGNNEIACSNCALKVPAPAGKGFKEFVPFLVSHLDEHANHCSGTISFSFQEDMGLFTTCTACDSISFIA